ncbi:hypothetical protein GOBAR_DD30103 [Gossypium barbadense]|nr:hypothetical protein GOBAR_DD30103 [Gossypium barbadense]
MNAIEFQKVQTRCRMQNGLVVNSDGRSGGLALMWKDELDVTIKSYSKHHIDSIVKLGCTKTIRVMGYYGHANPSERNSSWNMLRSVGAAVKEEWVVGVSFGNHSLIMTPFFFICMGVNLSVIHVIIESDLGMKIAGLQKRISRGSLTRNGSKVGATMRTSLKMFGSLWETGKNKTTGG